jgi:hypothetical protein
MVVSSYEDFDTYLAAMSKVRLKEVYDGCPIGDGNKIDFGVTRAPCLVAYYSQWQRSIHPEWRSSRPKQGRSNLRRQGNVHPRLRDAVEVEAGAGAGGESGTTNVNGLADETVTENEKGGEISLVGMTETTVVDDGRVGSQSADDRAPRMESIVGRLLVLVLALLRTMMYGREDTDRVCTRVDVGNHGELVVLAERISWKGALSSIHLFFFLSDVDFVGQSSRTAG